MNNIRFLPFVILACSVFLVLRLVGLGTNGGFMLVGHDAVVAQQIDPVVTGALTDTEQQTEGDPAASPLPENIDGLTPPTADVGAEPEMTAAGDAPTATITDPANGEGIKVKLGESRSKQAVGASLRSRRQELASQAQELALRENLLAATEKRIEARIAELKELEAKIGLALEDEDKQRQDQLKGLVSMYESMKPKRAATIFDRLEMDVLLEMVSQIKPRKMADILSYMDPAIAHVVTREIAARGRKKSTTAMTDLPKIGG